MPAPSQSEKAYRHLRTRLFRGELAPGARLVNRTLAHEMGMSFIPVREAISRLASEGLVDHIAGAGAFVRQVTRQELAQLYDVRDLFEPFAAAEAARHLTPHETGELESILAGWEETGRAILARKRGPGPKLLQAWTEHDERFHQVVVEASRNRWLAKIMNDVRVLSVCFAAHRCAPGLLTPEVVARTLAAHRKLLQALRDRDPARAESLVRQQLARGREEVLGHFHSEEAP